MRTKFLIFDLHWVGVALVGADADGLFFAHNLVHLLDGAGQELVRGWE